MTVATKGLVGQAGGMEKATKKSATIIPLLTREDWALIYLLADTALVDKFNGDPEIAEKYHQLRAKIVLKMNSMP